MRGRAAGQRRTSVPTRQDSLRGGPGSNQRRAPRTARAPRAACDHGPRTSLTRPWRIPCHQFPSSTPRTAAGPRRQSRRTGTRHWTSSGTSASSRTSTTASPRWPTGCSSSPAWSDERQMRAQYLDRMDIERERGITIKSQAVRLPWTGSRRQAVRAQPDRHPGARRLLLRGLPVAGGLRGRRPAGRRGAGDRGADAGQPLPGARGRPADHPGAEQDRPARRPAGQVRARSSPTSSAASPPTCCGSRPRPGRAWPSCSNAIVAQVPPPQRRLGRARPRADLRLGLRHLPRSGHLRPGGGRPAVAAGEVPDDVHPGRPRHAGGRRYLARADARPAA